MISIASFAVAFNDEVHFVAVARAPIQDRRSCGIGFAPREQIRADDIFQVGARDSIDLREVSGEPGIVPVNLRRLYQAFRGIDRIRFYTDELIGYLEKIQMALHCAAWQAGIPCEFDLIDDLAETQAGGAHQALKVI